MSQAVHLISKSIPGYGPSDSSRCLPCSGVSGRAVKLSTCPAHGIYRTLTQAKIVSLKCAAVEASFTCKASSSGQRRNPDFSRHNKQAFSRSRNRRGGERDSSEVLEESELPSSKNGPAFSLSSSPKYQATATPGPREKEIVELFRKVQAQLRERAAIKEEKKIEALQGQNKETETVDSLLKLLRKHSVEHGKRNSGSDGGGGGGGRDFVLDQPKQSNSFNEEKSTSFLDSNSIVKDESPEPNAPFTRPVSKFQRRSPVPHVKYMDIYSDKDTANSFSNLNSREGKRTGMVDTLLGPELEHLPESEEEEEPEPEPEPEPELEPERESDPEAKFSDELVFEEMSEIVPSDTDEEYNDGDGEEREQSESRDLTALKLAELRSLAKSYGLKGFSKMKKQELVELLSQCLI